MHPFGPERASAPRVSLLATCLCDAFFDDVAIATVQVLEHFGCRVEFPEQQTCCAQPAFNAGDWDAARPVARHTLAVFQGSEPVIVPSGSCARMLAHGSSMLFEGEPDREQARDLAGRSWELADYLVNGLGVRTFPGRLPARVAFHRSCHSRGTRYADAALTLLSSISELEVLEFNEVEQCCGFGGTFAVNFPNVSRAMGNLKLDHALATAPDLVVSADMGCLMHLEGLARKQGRAFKAVHLAQLLRDAMLREARPVP
jgi:L-lactate dehydrogenase complex protein LldE